MLAWFKVDYLDYDGTEEKHDQGIVSADTISHAAAKVVESYGEEDILELTIQPLEDLVSYNELEHNYFKASE